MRHVVDEVILDLRELLLPEDGVDGEDEDDQQHQGEYDGRNDEAHTRKDISLHVGEMDVEQSHLCTRVIGVEHLLIGEVLSFGRIVGTSVHLPSI